MAVFTPVAPELAAGLVAHLGLGALLNLRGITGGIENTNYFVDTEAGSFVLTLFERLSAEQLPFYLRLMKHLATHGIPVPDPVASPEGELLHQLCGKPAAVVNKLEGRSELAPGAYHCAQVGAMLARMHLAGRDFPLSQPNLRGLPWWNDTVPQVLPHLDADQAALLRDELAHQNTLAAHPDHAALPRGPVHADLFRDNVMFGTGPDGQAALSGFFDFYFAGVDTWLFDLAVCLNDWCVDLSLGVADAARTQALLDAYQRVRPLTPAERRLLPDLARAGALRFWISRLWDFYLPREATLLTPHDPTHFERILRGRRSQPLELV